MKLAEIEAFFSELDRRVHFPLQVILTGGAAAVCFGVDKVTQDIDFEVRLGPAKKRGRMSWAGLDKALEQVKNLTGITPQYSEDMERWSAVALPSKKSVLYKKIGKIEVRLLIPALWAVGKLTRYLASDVQDLAQVLKRNPARAEEVVRVWGEALGKSPSSSALTQFQRQVFQFLDDHAQSIWGSRVEPSRLGEIFLKAARRGHKITKSLSE